MNRARSASCWATCFASTAAVYSLPKLRWVCAQASGQRGPRFQCAPYDGNVIDENVEITGTLHEELLDFTADLCSRGCGETKPRPRVPTCSRCVMSCDALNWAMMAFSVSLTMDGITRSS
jgi:hypothetical protein